MKKTIFLLYGVICYLIFFLTFLYAIGFIGNFVVPVKIDGEPTTPFASALIINLLLLSLFAVQHSIMARPGFKKWWTGLIPEPVERSTYVLLSSVALIILFRYWQPLGGSVWNVSDPVGVYILYSLFAFGWGLVLVATFLINHFDLFGLRQTWLYFRGQEYSQLEFGTPWLYKIVRHPLYVGWFFAFWATPNMTVTHLLFAVVTTAYIIIATQFEEHDLQNALPEYSAYKDQVPMFIPRPFRKKPVEKKSEELKTEEV